jgi:hypothetical protein
MKTAKSSKGKTATPAKDTVKKATSKAKLVSAAPAPVVAAAPAPAPAAKPVATSPRNAKAAATAITTKAAEVPTSGRMATARREITPDLIAERAYIIWEQQGRPQGHDVANWLLAESQLKQEYVLTA